MESLTLIKIHNPFSRCDRDVQPVPYVHGRTLLDIRNEHFLDQGIHDAVPFKQHADTVGSLHTNHGITDASLHITISINGRVIPEHELAVTYPLAGDQILFVPVVHGGDNGLLRAALMIVVAVVASYVAGPVGSAYGAAWGAVASGVTMVIGGMVVNALLPPPKATLPTLDDMGNSQAYSWQPQTTQRQGVAIARWYGANKLYGNIIAAYLESNGDKQYVNVVIGLGVGPFKSIGRDPVTGSRAFFINDQPSESFQGVDIYTLLGQLNQELPAPFDVTKVEYPLSVKVVENTPYTYTTTGSAFDGLEIEISFPQGLWYANDSGGLDPHSVRVRVSIRKQGVVPWTIITKEAGTVKTSASGYWSLGDWDQWASTPGYAEGGDTIYVWREVSAGSNDLYDHNEGDRELGSDGWNYRWHWVGDPITLADGVNDFITMTGAQAVPIRKVFTAESIAQGQYEIKVENLTPDQTSTRYGDDLYLSAVREVAYDNFQYPRLAAVAVRALGTDQLSGSLRFSCLAECSYIRYWTGAAWVYDANDNPAWCAWDALTQPVIDVVESASLLPGYEYYNAQTGMSCKVLRYDGKDPSKLDLAAWTDWAAYCDALVPDGKGGTEKRCTFNGGFDTTTSTWEAAQQIALVGRGIVVQTGDGFTVAVDKPGTPVQMFTVGNIGIDSFNETFLRKADRASSLTIDFIDRDNGYERDTFTAMLTAIPGSASASIPMIGCTKRSEAWRHVMYRLYNNQYINRAAEITVGIDAIASVKGDLVNVQHDVPQWGFGGRLVTADANSVTLDQEVTIEGGKSYTVMVRLMDDTVVTRSVTNAAGAYTVLTVSAPLSSVPVKYDPYAFGETDKVVKPFRVLNIRKTSELECTLSLIEYNESIYNADSGLPVYPTPNYSSLASLPPVTGVVLDELLIMRQDGGLEDVIDVFFKRPSSSFYREAEIWFNFGAGWALAGSTVSERFRIPAVLTGKTYTVAVVTVNTLRDRAKIQNSPQESIPTLGKLAPPSDVSGFTAVQDKADIKFSWTHVPDGDRWAYEIRIGASWDAGTPIVKEYTADTFSWKPTQTGTLTFWIKAIDTSGIESATATQAVLTIVAPSVTGLSHQVVDNNVLLKWSSTPGTFPIDYYEVRKGDTYAGATVIGNVSGTFATVFEVVGGTYKYWITAVDTGGLAGVSNSASATVSQPPDFQLQQEWDDFFTGTKSNMQLDTGDACFYACANTTQTFDAYSATLGGTTMAEFVSAATYLIEPMLTTGYYEKTFDYGALIPGTMVVMTLTSQALAGSVTVTPKISVSANGTDWTDYAGAWQVFANNFQYVKARLDFAGTATDILKLINLNVTLKVKIQNDGGMDTVSTAATGKVVSFTKAFALVNSITVTPEGTTARFGTYSFAGGANPTQFTAYLFDKDGNTLTGDFSWNVKGY